MAGFKGQAEYSVDSKGRVALPAKMRRALNPEANETFTITRGFEQCIFLYPQDRWLQIEGEMGRLSAYSKDARAVIRHLMRWAEEVTLDGQGRLKLSSFLMDFAEVKSSEKVIIVGALDRIEVWNPTILEQQLNETYEDYETMTERVMGSLGP